MNKSREQVMEAFFALVSGSYAYKTKDRRFRLFSDVPHEERPALFILQQKEAYEGGARGTPGKTTLKLAVVIYVNSIDAAVPAAILNGPLDALDQILRPDNPATGKQTLGGLVDHCWIEGESLTIPGDLDGDGMAFVPVWILVP